MAREINAATVTALAGETLAPIGMIELEFDSGAMLMWTGIGKLEWNSVEWWGIGSLGQVGPIEETIEIRAVGVEMQLSGIPAVIPDPEGGEIDLLSMANEEDWQGRPARVYYAVLQGRSFVGDPFNIFDGFMDQMTLVEGEQATITLSCESKQIDLERTMVQRYTSEEQRSVHPGDAGADQVAALQDVVINLPRS